MNTKFRDPVIASDLNRGRGTERFVGSDGHVNASSDRDLAVQVAAFLKSVSESRAVTQEQAAARVERARVRREMTEAAFVSDRAHKELGQVMADELYQAANREGFMRRFFARQDLIKGQFPYVKMRMKNVVATVATGPVQVQTQITRDNTYTPPEFNIVARPFVEEREIQQSPGDVLDEKYLEAQEAIMVGEDRLWRKLALNTVNIANPKTTFVGTMTAGGLMTLRNQVSRWNIPVSSFLIANDLWNDIVADPSFQNNIDQVSKHELLLTGQLGVMFGMEILSDAYRHPEQKVLNQGEMFAIGEPINHGQYTDRGGITSIPTDQSVEYKVGRGWVLSELISMVLANPRSVAYATR